MGLFQSIPKDVILTHIIPYLLDFRDRFHLCLTCHEFWDNPDPLTKLIQTKKYQEAMSMIVQMTGENCFNYFVDFLSLDPSYHVYISYKDHVLPFTTNFRTLRFIRDNLLHEIDDLKLFDEECAKHLYYKFGEDIPEKYFRFLLYRENACAGFARVGNYNLYKRFYDLYYAEGVGEDEGDDLEHIAFEAGMGGNIEICNHFMNEHSVYTKPLFKGIAWSGNPSILKDLDPDEYDIMVCFNLCIKFATDDDQDFCSEESLNTTCKYLLENYPEVWEKVKLNKKQKITF